MQVVFQGEHLLQFHMARDSTDAALQYPTRYLAEENFTLETDIRLNRYIAQTQVSVAVCEVCLEVCPVQTCQQYACYT